MYLDISDNAIVDLSVLSGIPALTQIKANDNQIDNIKFSSPMGAFYSIIKLPIENAEDFAKFLLTDFSYKNQSVMLSPASGFYSSENYGKDEVRIAFVLNSEKLKNAIKIIKLGLKEFIG